MRTTFRRKVYLSLINSTVYPIGPKSLHKTFWSGQERPLNKFKRKPMILFAKNIGGVKGIILFIFYDHLLFKTFQYNLCIHAVAFYKVLIQSGWKRNCKVKWINRLYVPWRSKKTLENIYRWSIHACEADFKWTSKEVSFLLHKQVNLSLVTPV